MKTRNFLLWLAPCLAASAANAQTPSSAILPAPTVKDAGVYHLATGTWTRAKSPIAMLGTDVLYDNTCTVSFFIGLSSGETLVDSGRMPSPSSPTDASSLTGTSTSYAIDGFQLAYCTGEALVDFQVNFYQCYAPCVDATALVPDASITILTMPGAAGGTASLACWTVAVDLGLTSQAFSMFADCDGTYDGMTSLDNFGWSWLNLTAPASGQPQGPLLAGDPAGISTGTACPYGDGTFWSGNANAGTGIGSEDMFETDLGGAMAGCWFFGGYPQGNAYSSFYMQVSGSAVPAPPGNDDCSTAFPLVGQGSFPFDLTTSTTGIEGQNETLCYSLGSTGIDNDVWFSWTADSTGSATVSTCTSGLNTKIAAYPGGGCPTDGTALDCNDDSCGAQSELCFPVVAGGRYLLQVGNSPGAATGSGMLDISITPDGIYDRQLVSAWFEDADNDGLEELLQLQMVFLLDSGQPTCADLSFDVVIRSNGQVVWQGHGADILVPAPNPNGSCQDGCPQTIPCGASTWNSGLEYPWYCDYSTCYDEFGQPYDCCKCVSHYNTTWGNNWAIYTGPIPTLDSLVSVEISPTPGSQPEFILGSEAVVFSALGSSYCTAEANSSGLAAIIQPGGTSSVSAASFSLSANRIPSGQPGIFYFGANSTEVPFGNGVRCVGGQIYRMPVVPSSFGVMEYAVFDAPVANSVITPGSTWNFQSWYRDPAAGGSGFNLSNGYTVTFTP